MLAKKFKIIKDLGSGAQGNVKLVKQVKDGKLYAAKIMKSEDDGQIPEWLIEAVQNEVQIVNSLDHNNIYKILGVGDGEFNPQNGENPYHVLFTIMEYAENGELFDLIKESGGLSEEVARYFFI